MHRLWLAAALAAALLIPVTAAQGTTRSDAVNSLNRPLHAWSSFIPAARLLCSCAVIPPGDAAQPLTGYVLRLFSGPVPLQSSGDPNHA